MRAPIWFLFFAIFFSSAARSACTDIADPKCRIKPGIETIAPPDDDVGGSIAAPTRGSAQSVGMQSDKPVENTSKGKANKPLWPVRAYLKSRDIPPRGVGAYGVVVLTSKPTSASQDKLSMFCKSYIAHFPRSERAATPISDQMITIWPLENPSARLARQDDCKFVLDRYDLNGATAASIDARAQGADLSGPGPFLIGWSPATSRSKPDALVLVVDFANDETQDQIDRKFDFWKNEIVQDPAKWRRGFVVDRIKESIRKFVDKYGQAMLDAIKLVGAKS